jgi:hypothetical protein
MPRVRRKDKHRPNVPDEAYIDLLSTGTHWEFIFDRIKFTDAELADLWAEFGERVTEEHIAQYPCTRPWGWWRFEAAEPRRVVDGWEDPRDGYHRDPQTREYSYGRPATRMSRDVSYESECEFLERLFLLTEAERSALAVDPGLREAGR